MEEAKLRTLSRGLWRLLDDQIGSEQIIEMRREVVKLQNMVNEYVDERTTQTRITVGSQAEGLMMRGSDCDVMYVDLNVRVLQIEEDQNNLHRDDNDKNQLIVKMEQNQCKPGFTLLKILSGNSFLLWMLKPNHVVDPLLYLKKSTKILDDVYLSCKKWKECSQFIHIASRNTGPSTSGTLGDFDYDLTEAIKLPIWPEIARGCIQRLLRRGWPDQEIVLDMVSQGCHLVPKSSRISEYPDEEWMISFVIAEKILIAKLTHSQFLCYCLLKFFFREAVNYVLQTKDGDDDFVNYVLKTEDQDDDFLSSYFAKTVILWQVSEGRLQCCPDNLLSCFWSCFQLILKWLSKNYVPNFFIPANNMLEGKFTTENRQKLMKHLESLYRKGYRCLYECSILRNKLFSLSQHFNDKKIPDVLTEKCPPRWLKVGKDRSPFQFTLGSKDRVGMIWVKYPEAIPDLQSDFYVSLFLAIENHSPCGPSHYKKIDEQVDLVMRIELAKKKITSKSYVQEHTLATWFRVFSIKLVFTYFMNLITESKIQNRRMYHTFRKTKKYILKDKDDVATERLYYAIILYEMGIKDDEILKKVKHLEKIMENPQVVFQCSMNLSIVKKTGCENYDFPTWKRKYVAKQIELKTETSLRLLRPEHLAAESFNPLFDSIIYSPLFLCYILRFLILHRKKNFKKCTQILDQYHRRLRLTCPSGNRFIKRRDIPIIKDVYGILNFMMCNYGKAYTAYIESLKEISNIYLIIIIRILVIVWEKLKQGKTKKKSRRCIKGRR